MYQDKKDEIINALHDAAHEVSRQQPHEHHAMLQAGAIPPWVSTLIQSLIQTMGPQFAQALITWLSQFTPQPQPTPNPPTNPIGR